MSLLEVLVPCSSPRTDPYDIRLSSQTVSAKGGVVGQQLPLSEPIAAAADIIMHDIDMLLQRHRSDIAHCVEKWLDRDSVTPLPTSWRSDCRQQEERERKQKKGNAQEPWRLWEDVDSSVPPVDCSRFPESRTQLRERTGPELDQVEPVLAKGDLERIHPSPKAVPTLSMVHSHDGNAAVGAAHLPEQAPLAGTSDERSSHACTNGQMSQSSLDTPAAIEAHEPGLYPLLLDKPDAPAATRRCSLDMHSFKLDLLHQDVKARLAAKIADSRDAVVYQKMSRLHRFTTSARYEQCSCFLVLLNCFFVGFATQYHAQLVLGKEPFVVVPESTLHRVEGVFLAFFAMDLIVRWVAGGLFDFWRSETAWNLLDLFVVVLGTLDLAVEVLSAEDVPLGTVSALRVLRIIRVVRLAKVVRVMRFFRELRLMVYSIASSLKSLCWVVAVLLLLLYGFGVFFTVSVTEFIGHGMEEHAEEYEPLVRYFGTLDRAVLSLFMAMSGGNDWAEFLHSLQLMPGSQGSLCCTIFLCFITFATFAVINIVTGIFVENATQSSANDKTLMVQEQMENKKVQYEVLRCLFVEMDKDNTGFVKSEDFSRLSGQEDIRLFFEALQLDVKEATSLFKILDRDGSGEIHVDEFIEGCYSLQGEATSLEQKAMHLDIKSIRDRTATLADEISSLSEALRELRQDIVACKR